ncbi:MAG: hypothetical protein VXW87_03665 [Pseudomonadota bacterium]|nr:hypothetical protein [Pseudomonadota bacterium]
MDKRKLTALMVMSFGCLQDKPASNIIWIQQLLVSSPGRVMAIIQKHQSWEVKVSESHQLPRYPGEHVKFCRKKKHAVLCRIMVGRVSVAESHESWGEL